MIRKILENWKYMTFITIHQQFATEIIVTLTEIDVQLITKRQYVHLQKAVSIRFEFQGDHFDALDLPQFELIPTFLTSFFFTSLCPQGTQKSEWI